MKSQTPQRQAGFTLIETLVAMVVLTFGLLAVTNLLLMATTDNFAAAQSTIAVTAASQQLDFLRRARMTDLVPGGDLTADLSAPGPCPGVPGIYNCIQDVATLLPGAAVGGEARVRLRWTITSMPPGAVSITVQAVPLAALAGQRSMAEMTTIRTCTAVPPPGGAAACPAIP